MKPLSCWLSAAALALGATLLPAQNPALHQGPASIVITNARVLTIDHRFSEFHAVAIRGNTFVELGEVSDMRQRIGDKTRVIDARGGVVMPGIIDNHVHSLRASVSELAGPLPVLRSLAEAQDYIRQQAASKAEGEWICLDRVYPTRLKEGRLPRKAELDAAAPRHPVCWNAGPVAIVNSKALEVAGITKDTPDPKPGVIVKDPQTGEPTGVLRNAASLLKLPAAAPVASRDEHKAALKKLYHLYNQQGITGIGERRTDPSTIDLFREMSRAGDLSVRVNCTVLYDPFKGVGEGVAFLDSLTNPPPSKRAYGPTGAGDDWVRTGPFKVLLDGGMLIGTAYMREPWGVGDTYQITDPQYKGLLNIQRDMLEELFMEAAKRGWQLTAHCTGEGALDVLLEAYERIQRHLNIRTRRFYVTHGNFLSQTNLDRCKALNISGDLQPIWLYKDGASLLKTLGERRMEWFLPLKTWMDNDLVIGGGSDHMTQLDPNDSTNPYNPWLGIWAAVTRQTELGGVHNADEGLTIEQALRMYTYNNAWLNQEESRKGSIEFGKLADCILLDRDVLSCPVEDIRATKVLATIVDGKMVWESPALTAAPAPAPEKPDAKP